METSMDTKYMVNLYFQDRLISTTSFIKGEEEAMDIAYDELKSHGGICSTPWAYAAEVMEQGTLKVMARYVGGALFEQESNPVRIY